MSHERMVARHLLAIHALRLDESAPFTLTSGAQSPLYIDVRRLLSFPKERSEIMTEAAAWLKKQLPDSWQKMTIAGGESAGIPFAAILAQLWHAPLIYVRKQPKNVGLQKNIEGMLKPHQPTLLVEDILTQGGSKAMFLNHLRDAQADVRDIFVPISYHNDAQQEAFEKKHHVRVHSLSRVSTLLDVAQEQSLFPAAAICAARQFLTEL